MLYYILYIISCYIVLYYIELYYITFNNFILYILESQAGSPHSYPKWLVESFGQNVQREIFYTSK